MSEDIMTEVEVRRLLDNAAKGTPITFDEHCLARTCLSLFNELKEIKNNEWMKENDSVYNRLWISALENMAQGCFVGIRLESVARAALKELFRLDGQIADLKKEIKRTGGKNESHGKNVDDGGSIKSP